MKKKKLSIQELFQLAKGKETACCSNTNAQDNDCEGKENTTKAANDDHKDSCCG